MPRLIRVFAGRTLILLVLSCRGSFVFLSYSVATSLWPEMGLPNNYDNPDVWSPRWRTDLRPHIRRHRPETNPVDRLFHRGRFQFSIIFLGQLGDVRGHAIRNRIRLCLFHVNVNFNGVYSEQMADVPHGYSWLGILLVFVGGILLETPGLALYSYSHCRTDWGVCLVMAVSNGLNWPELAV